MTKPRKTLWDYMLNTALVILIVSTCMTYRQEPQETVSYTKSNGVVSDTITYKKSDLVKYRHEFDSRNPVNYGSGNWGITKGR